MTNRSKENRRRRSMGLPPIGMIQDTDRMAALQVVGYLIFKGCTISTMAGTSIPFNMVRPKLIAWRLGFITNVDTGRWCATSTGMDFYDSMHGR